MLARWFPRRRWLQVVIVVMGLGGVIALTVPAQKLLTAPDLPILVEICERKADSQVVRQFQVRDKTFLTRMDELFPGYRRTKAGRQPTGDHVQLDFIIQGEPHARTIYVWEDGGKEFWSGVGSQHAVQGRFGLLLKCLPIRRMFEMLNSAKSDDRDIGTAVMAESGDQWFEVVLESCHRQTGYARREAVRHLVNMVAWHAPKAPRTISGYPIFIRQANDITGSFPAEHPQGVEIRHFALQLLEEPTMERDATEILALVADEATIDELTRRLTASTNWTHAADLIVCLQACLGLPADFERGGMCGNSSAAEFRQFAASEELRTKEAQQKLLAWLRDWKAAAPAQRLDAVVTAWQPHMEGKYRDYGFLFEDQLQRYRNLLRRGSVLLPAVEAAQTGAADIRRRGVLEFAKAYWTGRCDHELVEQLLRGDRQQQMLACDIIAAAQDSAWKNQLASLLTASRSSKSDEFLDSNHLEIKATETLVICHGIQALPLLETSRAAGRGNNVAQRAFEHFQVPTGDY